MLDAPGAAGAAAVGVALTACFIALPPRFGPRATTRNRYGTPFVSPPTVSEVTPLEDIVELMERHRIKRVPVVFAPPAAELTRYPFSLPAAALRGAFQVSCTE